MAIKRYRRLMAGGAPLGIAVVIAATLGVDPYVLRRPESMLVPVALVICITLYMFPLLDSDVRHRVDSTLDELTGARATAARKCVVNDGGAPCISYMDRPPRRRARHPDKPPTADPLTTDSHTDSVPCERDVKTGR